MLDIFVCEDNEVQRRTIVQIIQNTVLIEELDMQLVLDAGDPYILLERVKTSQNTGIYFLDIDLGSNMNGLKLAQQIRLYDPRGFIIFVTAHCELSYMTFQYRVEAMDFVLKPCRSESENQGMSVKCNGTLYTPDQQNAQSLYHRNQRTKNQRRLR